MKTFFFLIVPILYIMQSCFMICFDAQKIIFSSMCFQKFTFVDKNFGPIRVIIKTKEFTPLASKCMQLTYMLPDSNSTHLYRQDSTAPQEPGYRHRGRCCRSPPYRKLAHYDTCRWCICPVSIPHR